MNIGFTGYAGNNNTAATSFTFSYVSDLYSPTYSNLSIIGVVYDNSTSGGAGPNITSIVDGNSSWTQVTSVVRDPSTAGNGTILGIWRATPTQSVAPGTFATVSFSGSTTAKAWVLYTFTDYDNGQFNIVGFTGRGGAGTSTINVTVTGFLTDEMALGIVGVEENSTRTGATSTVGGTWSDLIGAGVGTGAAGQQVLSQVKRITSNSDQSYNPTWTNGTDWAAFLVRINTTDSGGFDPFGMMGIYGI